MYFWTRCQNYTVRYNKFRRLNEGSGKTSHHTRIYNNECSGNMKTTVTIMKNCKGYEMIGEVINCTIGSVANLKGELHNNKFLLDDSLQYISDMQLVDCDFELVEGVTQRNFRFNKRDGVITLTNCDFKGGRYSLIYPFNADFNNCTFDSMRVDVNACYEDNDGVVYFKDCVLPIDGCLLKIGANAYNRGIINVIFENCTIVDSGNYTLDGYGAGSALMNAFAKPIEGSSVTFKNCIIDKPTGLLLEGYPGTVDRFKLDLIFENTPLSENLQIQEKANFKDYVNLIIK